MAREALLLRAEDDVAVALARVAAGQEAEIAGVDGQRLVARQDIPLGHKIAIRRIEAGETVRKLGHAIGVATCAIEPGEHVHVHNLASQRGVRRGR